MQELAREYTPEATEILHQIMTDRKQNGSARVQAATQLLDMGWGRPKQSVDVKADHNASGLAHAIAQAQKRMAQQAIAAQQANVIEGTVIEAHPTEK